MMLGGKHYWHVLIDIRVTHCRLQCMHPGIYGLRSVLSGSCPPLMMLPLELNNINNCMISHRKNLKYQGYNTSLITMTIRAKVSTVLNAQFLTC